MQTIQEQIIVRYSVKPHILLKIWLMLSGGITAAASMSYLYTKLNPARENLPQGSKKTDFCKLWCACAWAFLSYLVDVFKSSYWNLVYSSGVVSWYWEDLCLQVHIFPSQFVGCLIAWTVLRVPKGIGVGDVLHMLRLVFISVRKYSILIQLSPRSLQRSHACNRNSR